jgi:hypothetical protein
MTNSAGATHRIQKINLFLRALVIVLLALAYAPDASWPWACYAVAGFFAVVGCLDLLRLAYGD